ncbi:MAG: hypothetical protein WAU81_09370 [Candidatus Aminicenantales bacterium]
MIVISLVLSLGSFGRAEEPKKEPPHWKGDVSLGLSLARGNAQSSSFSFTLAADGPVNMANTLIWANKPVGSGIKRNDVTFIAGLSRKF